MKKFIFIIALGSYCISCVFGESIFLESYKKAEADRNTALIYTVIGGIVAVVGLGWSYAGSLAPKESYEINWAPIIIGGLGGGILGGGYGYYMQNDKKAKRLDFAMKNESVFTASELAAIQKNTFFIGMSQDALVASLWYPEKINQSSYGDQWCYRLEGNNTRYIYTENGIVRSWN